MSAKKSLNQLISLPTTFYYLTTETILKTLLYIGLSISALIFSLLPGYGQAMKNDSLEATQYYNCSSAKINIASGDVQRIIFQLDSLQRLNKTDSLLIRGNSSPDGPYALNDSLARMRAIGMRDYVTSSTSIPDNIIDLSSYVSSWPDVVSLISNDPSLNRSANAIEAKRLISVHSKNPASSLRRAYGGRIWKWLAKDVFPLMRKSTVTVFYDGQSQEITNDTVKPGVYLEDFTAFQEVDNDSKGDEKPSDNILLSEWQRHIYVKTNLPAWLCLWLNAAFEVDMAPHWSFSLPVYYSGFNYFKRTLKFRTFAVQPEFRWFPNADNHGFFAGAHAGVVYYNIALNGKVRYQDHDGTTPALGGGLAIGYRFRLNSNPNIYMEASIGGGIYSLHYDEFLNETNGLKVGERKRTFYGIDQASLSFVYRFDCGRKSTNKKGGGQ